MLVEISFSNTDNGNVIWKCNVSRVDKDDPDLHEFTSSIFATEHWEGDVLFFESIIQYSDLEHADADVIILSDELRAFIHREKRV